MSTGAQPSLGYSVVNPPPDVSQQHSLAAAQEGHPDSILPNYSTDAHALLDHCQPECNLLVPAPAFTEPASASMLAGSSENGAVQDSGFCIVCGHMQNNLVSHMAGHSKEDMIVALMNKSDVSPFRGGAPQGPAMSSQPLATSRVYSSPFTLTTQSSSSNVSVNSRDGSCLPASDNAAVAAAALLHLGGNLSDSADRIPLNNRESRGQFSPWVNLASSTCAPTPVSNASALHTQPPPDYHQHHTRLVSHTIPANPQEPSPNYGSSYFLATPQSHDTQGNNPSVYSTNQCSSSVQALQYGAVVSVNNSIPISASQGSSQGSMSSILSVASHAPLIMMPSNVAGKTQETPYNCAEINIPVQRQEPTQRGTLTVRPQYQLVQPQSQLRAAVARAGGGGISVIGRPALPVKYIVLNNNGNKFLSPVAPNVRFNASYLVNNNGTIASVQTPVIAGSPSTVQVAQVNQGAGVAQTQSSSTSPQSQVLVKVPEQCIPAASFIPSKEAYPNTQLCARTQLFPSGNLGESHTNSLTLNVPLAANTSMSHAPSDAKVAREQPTSASGHSSTPGTSGSATAQQPKALTTVHVGNNITIFVPKDMADQKDRLQQIITEELVRGILLNDSKGVTVDSSTKCSSETESCDSGASKASGLLLDEPGPSRLPASKKSKQMKVEFFENVWDDESFLNGDHEISLEHKKLAINSASKAENLSSKTSFHPTQTGAGSNAYVENVVTSSHGGTCSTDASVVKPQERIFLKDTSADQDLCEEEALPEDTSLAPSDPLSLLGVECSGASEKDATVLCEDANDHQVLPISMNNSEETFVTSFTNLLKQDNSDDHDGFECKKRMRPHDSPFTSGSSSFRVMSLCDVKNRNDSHISQLEVKVKQDEPCVEEERVLFSPTSMLSTSTEGPPPEEDLSLRTAETLADSDSEHGPAASRASCLSGVDEEDRETPAPGMGDNFYQHRDHCFTDPSSVLHLTMDASESLATSEVLLANLSSEESGSLPPHPHGCTSPLLYRTQASPKQYRSSSRRSHSSLSSLSSSADSLSSCQSSNSPMDLRNASLQSKSTANFSQATRTLATSSHAGPDVFQRPPTEESIFGPPFSNFGYHPTDPSVVSSTCSKQSEDIVTPSSSSSSSSSSFSSSGSSSSYLNSDASKREHHYQEETAVSEGANTHQARNLLCKGESSERDAGNAGVVLNLDSCTVLPENVNFSQWFPTSTSSFLNQRQPSFSHQPDASASNAEANTNLCFSSSDILRNISSYLSPRDAGTSATASHFEEDNGVLSSLDTSLNLGAEFALPYDDVGLVVMSPSRSPAKNEPSPKKIHHSPRVMMSSPQPSTSGFNKRPLPPGGSGSTHEAEYEFDYDSDCYADSDCELQALGRSSLPLDHWKCHLCNKLFKSLKEKLLHAGKHSPGCVGPARSSVSSWHRAVQSPAKLATHEVGTSVEAKSVPQESAEDVKLFTPVKREKVKMELVIDGISVEPEAEVAFSEGFIEGDLNLKKLKTLEACRTEDEVFKCPECFAQFQCADDLLSHRKKVLSSKNSCPLCHQEFRTRTARSNHIKASHSVREYRCTFCYMAYKSLSNWRRHQLVHLGIVPFECNRCGKRFTRRFEYLQHERVHTGEKPYVCVQCPKTFANESNLRRHIFTHSDDQQAKCETCDKVYKNPRTLMKHKLAVHPAPGKTLKIQRDFICSFENCGLVFPSTKKLSWHQETHQRWPKRCEFCQERFVHKSNLVKHIRQKHDAQYQQDEDGNRACPICFKVFLKTSLPQHMRIHSGAKPYKCYMCNKKFRVKCNLDAHMFVHSGKRDRPHKCSLCVRSFCREKDLEAHIRSHKNIRPFTCNECGKSFIHKNNLTAHIAQHSGRKEHTCIYCAKTFFRKYNLRNHERVHTGETPYSCPICGKTFTQKSNYNVHRKSFHVDRHIVHEEI